MLRRSLLVLAAVCLGSLPLTGRAQADAPCSAALEVMTTAEGVEYVRTPDACFENLPDWDFAARFVEIDGLRQGYVDEGPADGPVILMLHGQPSWSYLYRFMIPALAEDGYRVIAMDHLGFGTSDKPVNLEYPSFQNHADRLVAFMTALGLQDVTLFAQDWGSVIGLYVAGGDLDRFGRIVIGNGGLPVVEEPTELPENVAESNAAFHRMLSFIPDNQPPFFDAEGNSLLPVGEGSGAEPFGQWVAYARLSEDFRPSLMVEALTFGALTDAEKAAYDAPYPSRIAMTGPRTFPGLRDDLIGITEARRDALTTYEQPFLTIFGGNDPGLVGEGDGQPWMTQNIPGAAGQPHQRLPDASHFLQDDKGPEIAEMVDASIRANP